MFAMFGREARRVIELAEDHARALWRPAVGPDHLLLALLAVDDSGVFTRSGLCFDAVRARMFDATKAEVVTTAKAAQARHLPLRLRSVFRDAFRHAAALASPEVTPLHIALALLDEPPGEVAAVLRALEVPADRVAAAVRAEVLDAQTVLDLDGLGDTVVRLPRPDAAAARADHLRASALAPRAARRSGS